MRFRIVREDGVFYIQQRLFILGWVDVTEWLGCDPLGFDYGYGRKEFESHSEAKIYLENEFNKNVVTVEEIEYERK